MANAVFKNNNSYVTQDATFASATTTDIVDLNGAVPVAVVTPASFGQTSITFQHATTIDGTFYDVYDYTGTKITLTVSSSAASWTDITSVFPASCGGFLKLITGGSVSKTVQVISRNAS